MKNLEIQPPDTEPTECDRPISASTAPHDLVRSTLSVLVMVGFIAASFWILRPFIPAMLWATMIVVAGWPLMQQLEALLWRRRWLAVTVMTLALLLVFVVPFSLAVTALVTHLDEIVDWAQSLKSLTLPAPPSWIESIPLAGTRIASSWRDFASSGPDELARSAAPYAKVTGSWLLAQLGSLGAMTGQFMLTVLIAAVLFARGDSAVADLRRFGRRLAGARGEQAVNLAGQAIRGVALGIVLVAMGQAVLGGIGLFVAGVPFAAVLTALMFLFGIVQVGVVPVLAIAVAWLYWQGSHGWATGLLVWTIFVGTIDNVIRPILIQKGAQLPLVLIIAGVIGGLIAFGVVGIFVGPVVLGVGYMLFEAWIQEEPLDSEEGVSM
jgi:predicted PurR-regulated permease PerM